MIFCSVNGLLHIRAKKLPKFTLAYGKLDSLEQSSVKFESKYNTFHWRKCIPKCRLQNIGHLVPASMCYSALFTTAWDPINRTNSAWSGDNFDYSVFCHWPGGDVLAKHLHTVLLGPEPLFTKKTPSYRYKDTHYKHKTVFTDTRTFMTTVITGFPTGDMCHIALLF